ncbi:type I restriction endonuclease [Nitrospirillum sp. BR 11163]|uniref:type I restriction endonuclease n=1 Tax=Nitrospirillum sp. BR 11163 TaxID=3104323 RepID=UPI002AFE27BC|nr:type I restriction endonuclease [Nitrospirillum sp. BR 11163]MEA1674202.1 type I restriction enzyme HsdR N-terminal domain-containing protein [Nitrospirillum sp. BR 11163]
MELVDKIKSLAGRIERQKGGVLTEEACKNAFVMPFLSALGYDVFNPEIVIPEFTADVGTKKGEKVDYAININGKLSILVECKGCGTNLAQAHMSQLFRYFSVTDARFAILTNGIEYWFYSDLDAPNKMDQRPFFKFNIVEHRPNEICELEKFSSDAFDVGTILSTASNLKYSSALKAEFMKEIQNPSEEFIRMLVARVFDGRFTAKIKDDFTPLVATAIHDSILDLLSVKLTNALEATTGTPNVLSRAAPTPSAPPSSVSALEIETDIETTEEELEGFYIVKAIVRSVVKPDRIFLRDAKSYCAILLDDNNRKPLIRLHFNSKSIKYISLFKEKTEDKIKIDTIDDIYLYSEQLRETAQSYNLENAKIPA